jgi:hypothetical protein
MLLLLLAVAAPSAAGDWRVLGQAGGPVRAVAAQGRFVYVGVGLRLVILDAADPSALVEAGSTTPFPEFVEGVAVDERYAYVADGTAGLRIVDISAPDHPVEVGAWESPGYAEAVAVRGSVAYLADGPYGLRVIDVSDPARPKELGSAFGTHYAFQVAVDGQDAFIAAAGAGLLIADISDPARPREVAVWDSPGYAYGVAVAGNRAYVADGWEGIQIVEVADPARPASLGSYRVPGWALAAAISGSTLYVADGPYGLRVLEVSDPAAPIELGSYQNLGGPFVGLALSGEFVYLADRSLGVRVIRASNASKPEEASFHDSLGVAFSAATAGDHAFVAAGAGQVKVFDVSNPTRPVEVGVIRVSGTAQCLVASGQRLYAFMNGTKETGLYSFDISDPARPTQLGYVYSHPGSCRDMVLRENLLYVSDEWGLVVLDVSAPASPKRRGFARLIDWPDAGQLASTVGLDVAGDVAYVTAPNGMKIVDVRDPTNPVPVGVYLGPMLNAQDVVLAGEHAFICGVEGLGVLSLADPRAPVLIGSIATQTELMDMAIVGNRLVAIQGGVGLVEFDVSNLAAPKLTDEVRTPGYALKLAARVDGVVVAGYDGGMAILGRGNAPSATVSAPRRRSAPSPPPVPELPRTAAVPAVVSRRAAVGSVSACTVTSTEDSGPGSFRDCLGTVAPGGSIRFSPDLFVPDQPATIRVGRPLPAVVSGGVTIDASDAGVMLDGSQTRPGDIGINVQSDGNVIKGLQITGFSTGIAVQASQNVIGGDRARGAGPSGEGNVLNGGSAKAVDISGERSGDNVIRGNLIGMDAAGRPVVSIGNGIVISGGAHDNFVGGATPSERNIINGYGFSAVSVKEDAHSNVVAGNYIGTDISGMKSLGGLEIAVNLHGPNNRIGGWRPEERNLISGAVQGIDIQTIAGTGNLIVGNWVGLDATGENGLPGGGVGIVLDGGAWGNRVEGNVVAGFSSGQIGLSDWGTSFNSVVGNRIGTNAAGTRAIPGGRFNGVGGGAIYNRIGGTKPEDRNIVASGLEIGWVRAPATLVLGNYIGTDASGERGLNGNSPGVKVRNGAGRLFIGGTTPAEGNLISGNSDGVVLQPGADRVFIGANAIRGNRQMGVYVGHAEHSMMQANTVTGNLQSGIVVAGSPHNTLRQNLIYGHTGPGITLMNGGNSGLRAPVVSSAAANLVSGTACPRCTVEIFSDADDEGRIWEGTVLAAESGAFSFSLPRPLQGPKVTATATDRDGNTSAFSSPVVVPKAP